MITGLPVPPAGAQPVRPSDTQDDPPSWGLDRIDQRTGRDQKYFYSLTGVRSYVIDSGIRPDHTAFGGRVERGWSVDGADYCTAANAGAQHGTHVAATLGGGLFGVAKQAKIVNVKAGRCDTNGNAIAITANDLVQAVNWVTQDVKAKKVPAVVNISSIVGGNDAVDNAVKASIAAGVTYVVAAGNNSNDDCTSSPAEVPAAITVAASTQNDSRWSGTNYGSCVDIYAPGESIVSASSATSSGSVTMSGSSMAAPHVAGAAALILAEHPGFSPGQVADLLYANATKDAVADPRIPVNRLLYVPPPGAKDSDTVVNGDLNAMWNAYGDQGGHWTGGDETVSVKLPDGRTAWLFSDTFLGEVNPDRSRPQSTPLVHNSIVLQSGNTLGPTLIGGTAAQPKSLVGWETDDQPNDAGYWVNDGTVVGDKLVVFYTHYRKTGGGVLDIEQAGTAIATFSLPSMTLVSKVDLAVGVQLKWGVAVERDIDHYYIYGVEGGPDGQKFLHIARVEAAQLASPSAWEYWTGNAGAPWSAQESQSGRVMSGVGDGMSVKRVNGRYVLVTHDTNLAFNPDIVAYTADSLAGPFTNRTHVYKAPENSDNVVVYDARVHMVTPNSSTIVVSYNVNSLKPEDVYKDVRLYRPRFVTVTLPGAVVPTAVPNAPTGLTASPADQGIALRWTPPPGTIKHYWVYRRDVTAGQTQFARLPLAVTEFFIELHYLTNDHTYEFRVSAVNDAGEGPKSLPVSGVPSIGPPTHAPANLTAVPQVDGRVQLRWEAVPEVGVFYFVEQRDVTDTSAVPEFTRWPLPIVGKTEAVAEYLSHQHIYEFRVFATNSGGDGPKSNIARTESRTASPGAPKSLRADARDAEVTLNWTAPGPNVWYFTFIRDTQTDTQFTKLPFPITGATTFTYKYLTNKRRYEFKVVATNPGGEGEESAIVSATPQPTTPPPPSNLTATPRGNGTIDLSWTSPRAGTWFTVYQRNASTGQGFVAWPFPISNGTTASAQYLTHNERYEFKVVSTYYDLESTPTNTASAVAHYDPPQAPRNVRVVRTSDGFAQLSWDPPPGDVLYWVYQRDASSGQDFFRWGAPTDQLTVRTDALVNGRTYEFKVTATNQGGEGPAAGPVSVVASGGTPPAPTLSAVPGDGRATLSWNNLGSGVLYFVYRRNVTANSDWYKFPFPTDQTVLTDTMLNNGDTYQFRVSATNAHGEGAWSNAATVRPLPPLPPRVTGLVANPGDGQVTLNWDAPAPNVWYIVGHRNVSAGQSFTWTPTLSGATGWTHTFLTNAATYEYQVKATNVAGDGPASGSVTARPMPPLPDAPRNLRAYDVGATNIRLAWDPPANGINVWYWLYVKDPERGPNFYRITYPITGQTTFEMTGLTPGYTYQFKIAATNIAGIGPESNTVTARPVPPGGTACNGEYSNWIYTNPNLLDPQPVQLSDVGVHGCITRTGGTVKMEFSWSTNGYRVLVGLFEYTLIDCNTGDLLWNDEMVYPRGTDSTTGGRTSFITVDDTHTYRMRVAGVGQINTYPYSHFGHPPAGIRPTMAYTGCV